jgi:hypothetical protein
VRLGKSLSYYYPFVSSRAATILHHRKRVAEAMWGRLITCGRLVIGLPPAVRKIQADGSPLRLAPMRGKMASFAAIGNRRSSGTDTGS